jgi:hypothetical protein
MLVMATDVAGEFGGVLEAGSSIDLATACGSLVAANADDSCDSPHLHSETGLWIDGDGPFLDPDPGGCGFGTLE